MACTPTEIALGAARDGDLRLLKDEMASKVNLRKATGFKDRNALHRAAPGGHLEICRFLVEEAGFDANSPSAEGETPMLVALEYEEGRWNVHILKYLLARGGDPARPDARGYTPLHNAAEEGHLDAARLLLSTGVPVDPVNHRGAPLHLAAAKGHDQDVKILLEHGVDVNLYNINVLDKPNRVVKCILPPLVTACSGQFLDCMKLLVEAGADVNATSPPGLPVLMSVIYEGFTDIESFLLEAGADPNIGDEDGELPIMSAAICEQRELVEILFPRTKPIPSLPDWSIEGIIRTAKYMDSKRQDAISEKQNFADWKSQGRKSFEKGEYFTAVHFYSLATGIDPQDATLFANRSLCWLRQRKWDLAYVDARHCRTLSPGWSKKYKGAVDAFVEALKLDPASDEIKKSLREDMEAMKDASRCAELDP